MAFELKEGQGLIFRNKKQEGSQPHARGEVKINGEIYEISAWTKMDKNGDKFQSISVKPKQERGPKKSQDDGDGPPF